MPAAAAFATVAATHTSTSFLSCGLWAIDSCLGNCKGSCRGRLCLLPAAPDARMPHRWQAVRSRDAHVDSLTEHMRTHTMGEHANVLRPHPGERARK